MLWRTFSKTHWTAATALATAVLAGAAWLAARAWPPLPNLSEINRLAHRGDWRPADDAVQEYLARRPKDVQALFLAARIAAGMNDLGRCTALLDRVPAGSALKAEALVRQGQALWEWRDARRAEQTWRRALDTAEKQADSGLVLAARAELVSLLILERRDGEARELLWKMLPGHTEPWRLLVTLVRLEVRSTNPSKVTPILDTVLSRDPEDAQARLALALYMADLLRWDDVLKHTQTCLAQSPSDPRGLMLLLQCYHNRQQWDEMDGVISASPSLFSDVLCRRLIASRHEAAGRLQEAEASFREALDIDPFDPVTHYQLGQLLLRSNRSETAQGHMARSRQLQAHKERLQRFVSEYVTDDPQDWLPPAPDECVKLAMDLESLGRIELALAWIEESLRQQPDFSTAREHLGRLARGIGETAP
jgi:tetratricopeptide (TPR) repeat protein